jgi:hypothetical protein
MNCPTCGALVLKRVNFCGQCGTDLRQGSLDRWNNPPPTPTGSIPVHAPVNLPVNAPVYAPPVADSAVPPTIRQSIPVFSNLEEPASKDVSLSPQLFHLRTQKLFHLPLQDAILYIGKANDRQPPDIDLSGFPDADVVSRVHARLIVRSGDYYLEDLESSNGTYVNETVLIPFHPHLLTADDRISLGRNNLVSFSFSL